MDSHERLIDVIKRQAEIFLLDAGEFFPFGACIGRENEIIPIAAYKEDKNDRPESQPLIEILEKNIKRGLDNGDYVMGALAFDVFITEDDRKFDAITIRIIENYIMRENSYKYHIHENYVEFI